MTTRRKSLLVAEAEQPRSTPGRGAAANKPEPVTGTQRGAGTARERRRSRTRVALRAEPLPVLRIKAAAAHSLQVFAQHQIVSRFSHSDGKACNNKVILKGRLSTPSDFAFFFFPLAFHHSQDCR